MSYIVLARKWRPKSFQEMVGQEYILKALTHALASQRLHHAYLFSGTRGVGKTSLARLFAKGLNCLKGVSAHPCNVCQNCLEIEEGRFVDLIEIDAASQTKVENTKEIILDNIIYKPVVGRYKVYLIDEVHMLSKNSFNALLKTLEEPPSHVVFILATTEAKKLPITILSRCLQFNLRNISVQQIASHLQYILQQEQIVFDQDAVYKIAVSAQGSLRDSLSLLDQAIVYGAGQVEKKSVYAMLGSIDESYAIKLLLHLVKEDKNSLFQELDTLSQYTVNYYDLIDQMSSLLYKMTVLHANIDILQLELSDDEIALSKYITSDQIQLWYQMLLYGKQDLSFAPDVDIGFRMLMLRLLSFVPIDSQGFEIKKKILTSDNNNNIQKNKEIEHKKITIASPVQDRTEHIENVEVTPAIIYDDNTLNNNERKNSDKKNIFTESFTFFDEVVKPIFDNYIYLQNKIDSLIKSEKNDSVASKKTRELSMMTDKKNNKQKMSISTPEIEVKSHHVADVNSHVYHDVEKNKDIVAGEKDIHDISHLQMNETLDDYWTKLILKLSLSGRIKQVMLRLVLVRIEKHEYYFNCHQQYAYLLSDQIQIDIKKKISQYYNQDISVHFSIVDDIQGKTPFEIQKKQHSDKIIKFKNDLLNEPICQLLMTELNASLIDESIKLIH